MAIAIVQLSDIHIKTNQDPIVKRGEIIARAIASVSNDLEHIVVCLTGDVAFSGQQVQYEAAASLIDSINFTLQQLPTSPEISFVIIPGNHDLDLSEDQEFRDFKIEKILRREHMSPAEWEVLLAPQSAFWNFAEIMTSKPHQSIRSRREWSTAIKTAEFTLRFNCYNTACLSKLHEKAGELLAEAVTPREDHDLNEVTVAILHHPLGWFEPENARRLRFHLDETADIVLTGHEHEASVSQRTQYLQLATTYIESGVLQDNKKPWISEFGVLLLNKEGSHCDLFEFNLQSGIYARKGEPKALDVHNKSSRLALRPTIEFEAYLTELEVGFYGATKKRLSSDDIFVYPNLTKFDNETDVSKMLDGELLLGADLATYVLDGKRVFINGDDDCGKTTLAKQLFRDAMVRGRSPVFVDGENLSVKRSKIKGIIEDAAVNAYGRESLELFRQTLHHERFIVVDNYHRFASTSLEFNEVLEELCAHAEVVVCFGDKALRPNSFTESGSASAISTFKDVQMRPLNYTLRYELVDRWLSLNELEATEGWPRKRKIASLAKITESVIGKSHLPSYPLFVLSVLQSHQSGEQQNIIPGAYGYHYHATIVAQLSQALDQLPKATRESLPIGTIFGFLSWLAYRIRLSGSRYISSESLDDVLVAWAGVKALRLNISDLKNALLVSNIITYDVDGLVKFKYEYAYHFFLAKFLSDTHFQAEIQNRVDVIIDEMVEEVYLEDNANTLVMLVYLRGNPSLIQKLISRANGVHANVEPFDIMQDLDFCNRNPLSAKVNISLHNKSLEETIREHHADLDTIEELETYDDIATEVSLKEEHAKLEMSEQLQLLRDYNTSYRIVGITGQVLRNFAGELDGELKTELALACYKLSLRALAMMVNNIRAADEYVQAVVSRVRAEAVIHKDFETFATYMDAFLLLTALDQCSSVIRYVAYCVGNEQLSLTYEDTRNALESEYNKESMAARLIELSVELNQNGNFPTSDIYKTYDEVRDLVIPRAIVQQIVRNHFYLFDGDFNKRQAVGARLGINVIDPSTIGSLSKTRN